MKRAVRTVIRLLAAGLFLVGGMEIGLEFMRQRAKEGGIRLGSCLLGAVLIVLGATLAGVSGRLATRLTEDFEE